MTQRKQSGSIVTFVMLGLIAAGVLATIAYGSYYQIARGVQDTVLKANASALLTQAAYSLTVESRDEDGDGFPEPPAANGDQIPGSSVAPKTDAWGNPFRYCAWDNGTTNASTNRLTGENPAQQTSMVFALVSAGPDKVFDTNCIQAKTGLPAANSDDGVRTRTVADITKGVGGTYFYGDPVASVSALPATDTPAGKMRITLDTGIAYRWNGTSWLPLNAVAALLVTPGADCSGIPDGALGRDAADDLYLCKSSAPRIWKKVYTPPTP